jgi:hypothetical protein
MTVPQELKAKYPHATAVVRFPDLPSPRWFHSNGPNMDAVVHERGIFAHGDFLELVEGELPAVGTAVKMTFERSLLFVEDKATYEARAKRERDEAQERRNAIYRAEMSDYEARAAAANAKLNIPVRWTSGEKTVLSGLQLNGWGNGRNRRSVNHVLLLEPVNDGRFVREANTLLCTTAAGTDGQMWTGDLSTYSHGNDGKYVSCINCTNCLRLATRWKDPLTRVAPELIEDEARYSGSPAF